MEPQSFRAMKLQLQLKFCLFMANIKHPFDLKFGHYSQSVVNQQNIKLKKFTCANASTQPEINSNFSISFELNPKFVVLLTMQTNRIFQIIRYMNSFDSSNKELQFFFFSSFFLFCFLSLFHRCINYGQRQCISVIVTVSDAFICNIVCYAPVSVEWLFTTQIQRVSERKRERERIQLILS